MAEKLFDVVDPQGNLHQMTWANVRDVTRNSPGWKQPTGTYVHERPSGVAAALTEDGKDAQRTVVEVLPPKEETDPYFGVSKDSLQLVCINLEIEYDKRWGDKKLIEAIDGYLVKALAESGEPVEALDADARKKALALVASQRKVEWNGESVKDVLETFAAL